MVTGRFAAVVLWPTTALARECGSREAKFDELDSVCDAFFGADSSSQFDGSSTQLLVIQRLLDGPS